MKVDPRHGDVHALLEDDDGLHAGASGRHELAAVELQPEHALLLRLRQSGVTGNTATPSRRDEAGRRRAGALGSTLTIAGGFGQNMGTFSAVDATTGKIVWQKKWPESCYAGSTTTKATSSSSGATTAGCLPSTRPTANLLWSFQTGAGANDAPTIFEHNGTQYVAFYAGGNALAASPHGDNLWLFSLDGQLTRSRRPARAPASSMRAKPGRRRRRRAAAARANATAAAGKVVFADNCSTLPRRDGHRRQRRPRLTTRPGGEAGRVGGQAGARTAAAGCRPSRAS